MCVLVYVCLCLSVSYGVVCLCTKRLCCVVCGIRLRRPATQHEIVRIDKHNECTTAKYKIELALAHFRTIVYHYISDSLFPDNGSGLQFVLMDDFVIIALLAFFVHVARMRMN